MGLAKTKVVVEVLKAGRQLLELGNSSAALADVVKESNAFTAAYQAEVSTPTADSFQPNVLRAHMHCCI